MIRFAMIRLGLTLWGLLLVAGTATAAEPMTVPETRVRDCIEAAAQAYRFPSGLIAVLLHVEGGSIGRVSQNTNDTVDIGPMQVNQIWVPQIARHWHASERATYAALRDNFCANVEGGAWILRQAFDEARGDFWNGVGIYHSHNPQHKTDYLRQVLGWTLKLRDQVRRSLTADASPAGTP